MAATREDLPEDIEALWAALLIERARAARVEAELAVARAKASDDEAVIARQRLQIEKLTRQLYGQHSERTVGLIDKMELSSVLRFSLIVGFENSLVGIPANPSAGASPG